MIALFLCVFAFAACYWAGRRSLGQGLVMLLVFGYFYGILRANLLTTYSHFIFDAGMIGLYLARIFVKSDPGEKERSRTVATWVCILILWPALLVMLPFQPLLVSLVGLRGNTFFIPLLLLGSKLKEKDIIQLSLGLAVLDVIAVAFAGAEYFLGVPRFFPVSPVTEIIYNSGDAGGGFFRIPSTFATAHAFGATMVYTMPFLIGLWSRARNPLHRYLALATLPLAMLGVLMSATRTNFIFGTAMVVFVIVTTRMKTSQRVLFMAIVVAIAIVAFTNARFQRFKSLSDIEGVSERIAGSVNRGFWEILSEYPIGNGLGGGGTSIPYFLQGEVRNPVAMENEYARILSEQGVIGLLLWLGLIGYFFFNVGTAFAKGGWTTTRRLMWCLCAIGLGTAFMGTGLLTSIPGTLIMLVGMGWTLVPDTSQVSTAHDRPEMFLRPPRRAFAPAVR